MDFYNSNGHGTNPTEEFVVPFIEQEGFIITEFSQSTWGDKLHFTVRAKHPDGRDVSLGGNYGEELLDKFYQVTGIEDVASPLEVSQEVYDAGTDCGYEDEGAEAGGPLEGLIHEFFRAIGFAR